MNQIEKGPFPAFFRAALSEARRSSYSRAGWTLALHVRHLVGDQLGDYNEGEELTDQALSEDDPVAAVWTLIADHAPRCASAVPARRRATFLRGIEQAIEAERV